MMSKKKVADDSQVLQDVTSSYMSKDINAFIFGVGNYLMYKTA
jgi:hypothetical protein